MNVDSYLFYGYSAESSRASTFDFSTSASEEEIISLSMFSPSSAANLLDKILDSVLPANPDKVIVPISGGWDSRILLGEAVHRYGTNRIESISFGSPGLLDFDLGKQVARHLGVKHHEINLTSAEISWEALLESVKIAPWTYVPDGYYNQLIMKVVSCSPGTILLSGFMGEALTGGHFAPNLSKDEAISLFVRREQREKSLQLSSPGYDPRTALPILPGGVKTFEALDISVRQSFCIAPIVTTATAWCGWGADLGRWGRNGPSVFAPFADARWAQYWLGAPDWARSDQRLYREMMAWKFPSLAALPSKHSLGSRSNAGFRFRRALMTGQRRSHRELPSLFGRPIAGLNYLDFAAAFRNRDDYREVLQIATNLIAERNITPWLNLREITRQHITRERDREDALIVLLGLALNIQASLEAGRSLPNA